MIKRTCAVWDAKEYADGKRCFVVKEWDEDGELTLPCVWATLEQFAIAAAAKSVGVDVEFEARESFWGFECVSVRPTSKEKEVYDYASWMVRRRV